MRWAALCARESLLLAVIYVFIWGFTRGRNHFVARFARGHLQKNKKKVFLRFTKGFIWARSRTNVAPLTKNFQINATCRVTKEPIVGSGLSCEACGKTLKQCWDLIRHRNKVHEWGICVMQYLEAWKISFMLTLRFTACLLSVEMKLRNGGTFIGSKHYQFQLGNSCTTAM